MSLAVNSVEWNARISNAYAYGTKSDLQKLQIELLNLRQKLGEFIERYLDEYDSVMTEKGHNHPVWRLFRQKHEDYGKVEQLLRNVEYFMRK